MLDLEDGGDGEHHYRKALVNIDKAILQERNPLYLAQKATLLFLLGSVEESVKYFNEALAASMSESVRAEVLNNYACALAKGGDRHRALELFVQLEHDKNYLTPEVALVNQAHIYYEEKKFGLAKEKLLAAINFAPDYLDALYYLGVVCYKAGQYKESLQALDKTIQLESTHELAISLREKCCEKLMIC
jgi:tetratricopeptide (TPR) repeat protein